MQLTDRQAPIPIVPQPLLREHHASERHDNRFRACARLLQSLHRSAQGLAPGKHTTGRGGKRTIGSLLTPTDAQAGRNFLSRDIAKVARIALTYAEPGALISEQRLFGNLLTSQALAFNLFGPLALDHGLATRVLQFLLPAAPISRVTGIAFEHSLARNHRQFTDDRTAFDVAFIYERHDGTRALLGIELKYTEAMSAPAVTEAGKYADLAEEAGLYREPANAVLRYTGLRQLCREHLLAQAAVMREAYAHADFLLIAPADNTTVARAADLYSAQLNPCLPGHVPFTFISLERVVAFIDRAGASEQAAALHDRYTDWSKVDRVVAAFIEGNTQARNEVKPKPVTMARAGARQPGCLEHLQP